MEKKSRRKFSSDFKAKVVLEALKERSTVEGMNFKNKNSIRVLMFYDIRGWAWWHRINNIARNQPEDIKVDAFHIESDFDHKQYDFVIVFDSFLRNIISKVPLEKLIIGCSCPKKTDDFLKDLSRFKPLAGLVNNREMYNLSKNHYMIFNCPNGVDTDLFRPEMKRTEGLKACWVGNSRHFADKGLDTIISVCEKANIPLLKYDPFEEQYKILLPHIELRNRIYYKSSFYICFSEYEGTPNPALEALSCGLPVITTRVGNMPELIVDGINGFFSERNELSLFEVITKLRESNIREMSINARNSILNGWSWKNMAKNYTNMILSLKLQF